ncbi:TraR/DksA family transcriptional regulator [Streptomyces sp. V4-01]|uniref:TraR/DksA family transcriptional regulator n=1 Tax=Actinacidiphila polyblastidii TaxID=3110430 RepID=A0ABU7P8I5_9ACTN|nr:TraR/DksA family transcriptional regulator [Streptomyces sp. V4-01]
MVVKKAAAKKAAPRKSAAKSAAEKTTTGKAPARKSGTSAAKKTAAGTSPAKKTTAKKTTAKKTTAKKAAPISGTTAAHKTAAEKTDQAKTGARKVAAKKTVAQPAATSGTPVPAARIAVEPGTLAVLPGEDPWTPEEVEEARSELVGEVERLKAEIANSEAAVAGLLRDSGDGAGDEADTGSKNITREYEMALAANTREMLGQADHALRRLDEGTYGLCEVCGNPIGKARMQAFPRATLCLDDKQKQERR